MAEKGLGATVVPRHCVEGLLKSGKLLAYQPPGKAPLVNRIYQVSLKARPQTARVKTILKIFAELEK